MRANCTLNYILAINAALHAITNVLKRINTYEIKSKRHINELHKDTKSSHFYGSKIFIDHHDHIRRC